MFFDLFAASDCYYLPTQLNSLTISEFEYELILVARSCSQKHLQGAVNMRWSAAEPVFDPGASSACSGKLMREAFR